MWSKYTKNFCFRDCFYEDLVQGDVAAINKLLQIEQVDKNHGVFITTDILSVSTTADSFEAYKREDDETWELDFYHDGKEICSICLWSYKEVQLWFEIEENLETGDIKIHYCTVKGFKEYQV